MIESSYLVHCVVVVVVVVVVVGVLVAAGGNGSVQYLYTTAPLNVKRIIYSMYSIIYSSTIYIYTYYSTLKYE
jgi:hypothetical protein